MSAQCPNCLRLLPHRHNGCALHVVAQVARERGNVSKVMLDRFLASCDVDAFWDDLGRVVDRFEAGAYDTVPR